MTMTKTSIAPQMSASPGSLVRLFTTATDLAGRFPLWVVLAMARIAAGDVFWKSGQSKLASWDTTILLFVNEYQVPVLAPETAAALATVTEIGCALLLFAGLGSRFAAAALLGLVAVIQLFVYPASWAEHLLWATLLVLIATRGAGLLSLDHVIRRWFA
jgi:putative oxidoreductase